MRGLKRLLTWLLALMIIVSACFVLTQPLFSQPATTGKNCVSIPQTHDFMSDARCKQPSDYAVQSVGFFAFFRAPIETKNFTALMAALELALFVLLCVFCDIPKKTEALCFFIASTHSLRAPPTFA